MQGAAVTLNEQLALLSEQKCSLDQQLVTMAEGRSFVEDELNAERQRCVGLSTQRDAMKNVTKVLAEHLAQAAQARIHWSSESSAFSEQCAVAETHAMEVAAALSKSEESAQ